MKRHVRREDKEIADIVTLKTILKSAQYVTIAMSFENKPYLVSLSHGYDEEHNCIYFHCASEGKKLEYLEFNNTVWGQALLDYKYHEGECTHLFASVHFLGKVSFISDLDEKIRAMKYMIKHLDRNPEQIIARLKLENLNRVIVGKIDIEYMSGKKSEEVKLAGH